MESQINLRKVIKMGRQDIRYNRKQIHVWILNNQASDINMIKKNTGKSKTDVIAEALALYFCQMKKEGIL
jgi:hypothetical protein